MEIQSVVGRPQMIQPTRSSRKNGVSASWSPRALYFELKRRGVLEAGTNYTVVAWLIVQVAELIWEIFGTPGWMLQMLLIALVIGLPIALILAWALELTPVGLKLESEMTPVESIARQKGRGLLCALIAILVLTIGALVVNRETSTCTLSPQVSAQQANTLENG